MSAAPLIRELREAGIVLTASGDRLHVEAPAGTATPELRQRIAERKADLLVALRQPDTTTTSSPTDMRASLLVLADRPGIDHAAVVRLPSADLPAWATVPTEALPDYLRALGDVATRQAGKVPLDDIAPIHCAHCGPVFVHPAIAACLPVVNGWARAIGCPWCAIRKAGGAVPRPRIACETCTRFQPDTINPVAGVGTCASGHGTHHPMQRHGCGDFQPTKENFNVRFR